MASPSRVQFEKLLAPIPGDNPAGVNLLEDTSLTAPYTRLKDARSAARTAERAADSDAEAAAGMLPEWRTILELSPTVIATQSKDLQVAAWYAEALLRAHGFGGLRDGFKLMKGLVEQYWDNLYPAAEDGEDPIETRVAPLTGLSGEGAPGTLIQPIKKVPLTSGDAEGPYASWQYDQARETAKLAADKDQKDKLKKRLEAGFLSMEKFEADQKATPPKFWKDLYEDLQGCLDEFRELNRLLDEKAGPASPSSSNLRDALEAQRDLVRHLAGDKLPRDTPAAAEAPADAAAEGNGADGAAAAAPALPGTVLVTREDAFEQILKIADFFRKIEPQSFVPYTLEDVVRRGRMQFEDLLKELIPNDQARKDFQMLSGIKPRG